MKDRALMAASSLVGYCSSVSSLGVHAETTEEAAVLRKWAAGLLEYANRAAVAIDLALDEDNNRPTDEETK